MGGVKEVQGQSHRCLCGRREGAALAVHTTIRPFLDQVLNSGLLTLSQRLSDPEGSSYGRHRTHDNVKSTGPEWYHLC